MMSRSCLLVALILAAPLFANDAASAKSGYDHVVHERAEKIVSKLGLTDPAKANRVCDLVAAFYRDLNALQQTRDAAIKQAKTDPALEKRARDAAIKAARDQAEANRSRVHAEFIGKLNRELSAAEIDSVKDGLTYGVAPLTFAVYQQMLPDLTLHQKQQIHAWLIEAREHAMDGFTSEEKHAWFGKYKGRINNYLAKAGYDMKAAEKNLRAQR